jgi:branched-chain amino acid transport system permease protein
MDIIQIIQVLVLAVSLGCIYALAGIGLSLVVNATRIVNFVHGEFVMIGGVMTSALYWWAKWPLWVAALLTISVVVILGVGTERLLIRPLWKRQAAPLSFVMMLMAVGTFLDNTVMLCTDRATLSLPSFFSKSVSSVFMGVSIASQAPWIIAGTIAIALGLSIFFDRTLIGKCMKACAVNRDAAILIGISVDRMTTISFGLAAMVGAIAGILITPLTAVSFTSSAGFLIKGFCATVIGGMGNIKGALVGGLVIGILDAFGGCYVSSVYKDIFVNGF